MNRTHSKPPRMVRTAVTHAMSPRTVRTASIQPSPQRLVRPALAGLFVCGLLLGLLSLTGSAWSAGTTAPSSILVNINTATADELQALPGIGQSRASEIVAMRKERGAFRSVDELLDVRGIGPAMLERLRPQVALNGKTRLGAGAPAKGAAPAKKSGR